MATINHPERGMIDITPAKFALVDLANIPDSDYIAWRYPFKSRKQHMVFAIVMLLGGSNNDAMSWIKHEG